jgi:hypothetical protein
MTDHPNLASALAAVQAELPKIAKGETADTGKYTYTYADLADISAAVLPLTGKHGLAFTACPTVTDAGAFVLRYKLKHTSGEEEGGDYPLSLQGGPQAQGSLITYARRYTLCAVVGVAPEDDDGQAAQRASEQPAPKPRKVNLAELEDLIEEATDRKIHGDYDGLRVYAALSDRNLSAAVRKLRGQIDLHDSSGGVSGEAATSEAQPPVPAASPSAVEPAGSGEGGEPGATAPLPSPAPSPAPSTWDVDPPKPSELFNWRAYADKVGVAQGRAFEVAQKALAPDLQVKGPKSLGDACLSPELAELVRQAIEEAAA